MKKDKEGGMDEAILNLADNCESLNSEPLNENNEGIEQAKEQEGEAIKCKLLL